MTHLNRLENFLHFSHRQIRVSWQFGQLKWTALSAGFTGLLQELQSGSETVAWDVSQEPLRSRQI